MTGRSQQVTPSRGSVWTTPGMTALAAMTFSGFCGYAILLPVAPLWAVHGGASTVGAGLVNGVLLAATVTTQLLVPRALRRFGWPGLLTVGMALLGLPALGYAVSDHLAIVLALSAVRGVGFGIMTVTGSAAVACLGPPDRRGETIGAYGLAIALPNLVLLPLGPWIAEHGGFWLTFLISGIPLLGIPAALRLGTAMRVPGSALRDGDEDDGEPRHAAYARLARPMVLLLAATLAGGSIITFAPQMVSARRG